MARQLGFGRVPGLELSPEVPGIVPSVEYHNRVTAGGYTKGLVLNSAIGQGDNNVSPLQLVMAYAAIANGGTLYKPQVVRRIEDGEGHLIQSIEPVVVGKLQVKPQNLAMVTEGLRAVVNEPGGTAYWKRLKEVEVAGKTGTAQVIALGAGPRLKEEQMGYFQRDHAWFVAFAPAEKPEIAVVVLDEHGGHGGSVSAPPAMEIIKKYFSLKEESSNGESPAKPSVTPRPAGPLEPIQVPPPSPAHPRQAKGVSQEQEPWS
jgi:penicillin-binding protein 2